MSLKAKKQARTISAKNISAAPEVRRAIEHVGLFSRVAAAIQISPSHVLKVAKGDRQSSRVTKAIISEVRRIERQTAFGDRATKLEKELTGVEL